MKTTDGDRLKMQKRKEKKRKEKKSKAANQKDDRAKKIVFYSVEGGSRITLRQKKMNTFMSGEKIMNK